jgi:hypothetical protein
MAWLEVLVLDATVGRSDVEPAPAVGSRFAIPAAGLGFGAALRFHHGPGP